MAAFYELGPLQTLDNAMPADCWRVRVHYRDGTIDTASCDHGRWWNTRRGDEEPIAWQYMRDNRMKLD